MAGHTLAQQQGCRFRKRGVVREQGEKAGGQLTWAKVTGLVYDCGEEQGGWGSARLRGACCCSAREGLKEGHCS